MFARSIPEKIRRGISRALLIALAVAPIASCDRLPPLPEALSAVECPRQSEIGLAPDGYDVLTIRGTILAAPCERSGTLQKAAKSWNVPGQEAVAMRLAETLRFKKTPGGRFRKSDDTRHPLPEAANTLYAVESIFTDKPIEPWTQQQLEGFSPVLVATPAAFAGTGPETTFYCRSSDNPREVRSCMAHARSKNLHWFIRIKFGRPYPDGLDMESSIREGYGLLASHILSQE